MVNLANVLSAERKARIEQDDKTVFTVDVCHHPTKFTERFALSKADP